MQIFQIIEKCNAIVLDNNLIKELGFFFFFPILYCQERIAFGTMQTGKIHRLVQFVGPNFTSVKTAVARDCL